MRQRLLALAERRARLVARAREERAAIAALLAPADGAASSRFPFSARRAARWKKRGTILCSPFSA